MKQFPIILLVLLILTQCCTGENLSTRTSNAEGNSKPVPAQSREDFAMQQIARLESEDNNEREQARKAILDIANDSPELRRFIVRELIKRADIKVTCSPESMPFSSFRQWSAAVEILGNLKAIEAIDVLVPYLYCNSGAISLSTSRFPAARALVNIGEPAVPKLEILLVRLAPEGKTSFGNITRFVSTHPQQLRAIRFNPRMTSLLSVC